MAIFANESVDIRFVGFNYIGNGLGNVAVSFDGDEFVFATNHDDRGAEASQPEYRRFIERVVAGDGFDDDNDQHVHAADAVASRGVQMASAYADVCWQQVSVDETQATFG